MTYITSTIQEDARKLGTSIASWRAIAHKVFVGRVTSYAADELQEEYDVIEDSLRTLESCKLRNLWAAGLVSEASAVCMDLSAIVASVHRCLAKCGGWTALTSCFR